MLCGGLCDLLIDMAHLSSLQVKIETTPDGSSRLLTIPDQPTLGLTHGQRQVRRESNPSPKIVGDNSVCGRPHSSHNGAQPL